MATDKIGDLAVTTGKITDDAVTGDKVKESTLGTVPDASKLGGLGSSDFVAKTELLWALVNNSGALVAGSGATAATALAGTGDFRVTFNRTVNNCVTEGTATDVTGGAAPQGTIARFIGTDNRVQTNTSTVDVGVTNTVGAAADPAAGDGFTLTVYC